MMWSVAARFHLDPGTWTVRRLEYWYKGHVALYHEEETERQRLQAELAKGAKGGRR
jgi:hypothetical protein